MNELNIYNAALQSTYLGMPTCIKRSKTSTFVFLLERMWKSVYGWSDKSLSRAGKEVLLKSVVQAIPIYIYIYIYIYHELLPNTSWHL
jgi:hypothetical protein